MRELTMGRQLIRAIGYVVKSEETSPTREAPRADGQRLTSSEAAFFDALGKSGIELRVKDLQIFPDGTKKADWDVGMAVDAIRMAGLLDVIILVTGDGDFVPLVNYLKWGLGRVVEVSAFGRSASAKLKEAADVFVDLDQIPKVILKR